MKLKPFTPVIAEMSAQTMAVVVTEGDPNVVAHTLGAVYALRFQVAGSRFKVGNHRIQKP